MKSSGIEHRQLERQDNPFEVVFPSLLRAAGTFNSAEQTSFGSRGLRLYLDITAVNGVGPTLDIKIQIKDNLTGTFFDLPGASFVQAIATGTQMLTLYPGIAVSANVSVSDLISKNWRAVAVVSTGDDFTFSLEAEYLR